MNKELIERLKHTLEHHDPEDQYCLILECDARDIMSALSPVLPEDVQRIIDVSWETGHDEAADLIERLAGERLAFATESEERQARIDEYDNLTQELISCIDIPMIADRYEKKRLKIRGM